MPKVFIPSLLTPVTGGLTEVEVEGATVRQVIGSLDRRFPGIRTRLTDGDRLRSNISVAVDGEVSQIGLAESVRPESEVHFVTAIKGGAA